LSGIIRREGGGPGGPVAILHRNCHHYLETYFAAANLGAVLTPLNNRLTTGEISRILEDSGARVLVTERCFEQLASGAVSALSSHQPRLIFSEQCDSRNTGSSGEITDGFDVRKNAGPFRDMPAQLYYTSGTTGAPKGVILTHGNVSSHAESAIAELDLAERDIWLHAAPLFHLADAWATWAITMVGGRHVILSEFDPGPVFDIIEAEGVTITNLVPTMLAMLVHHPGADGGKLKSMRRILSGGAPMAPELLRRVESLFPCEYVQTYGLTETSPYLTLSLLNEELRRLPEDKQQYYRSTTGRPMRGVEVKVVDPDGAEIARDSRTVGEIVARGPTVTPGYFNRPEETKRAFRNGWFHTGDLARVDPAGYLTIVDRLKDVINTGGEQVYSTEVENVLYAHPSVKDAAVFAVPDETWGEVVRAAVVVAGDEVTNGEQLLAHCRTRLASFKVPRDIDFLKALPRTGSGKTDKKALREPHWRGRDSQVN